MSTPQGKITSPALEKLRLATGLPLSLFGLLLTPGPKNGESDLRLEAERVLGSSSDQAFTDVGVPLVKSWEARRALVYVLRGVLADFRREFNNLATSLEDSELGSPTIKGREMAFKGVAEAAAQVADFYGIGLPVVWALAWHGYQQAHGLPDAHAIVRATWAVSDARIDGAAVVWRYAFGTRTASLNKSANAEAESLSVQVEDQVPAVSHRFQTTYHSRQALGLHHWCSAPWHLESLKAGRGLFPFRVYGNGGDNEGVMALAAPQMQKNRAAARKALNLVAHRRGISPEKAMREVILAPWNYVVNPASETGNGEKLYSELGAEIMNEVLEELRKEGKGYGVVAILWHDLWRFFERNADIGAKSLPAGAEKKLRELTEKGMPHVAELASAFPGCSVGAILSTLDSLGIPAELDESEEAETSSPDGDE